MSKINSEGARKIIVDKISTQLNSVGLMFRIFSRAKTDCSIQKKISSDNAYGKTKKLQDLIGIRVVLYFNDDIGTVRKIISSKYSERSSDVSIDKVKNDEFKALRYNIVYSLDDECKKILRLEDKESEIDSTFELQIRTIFSEGWHEIEHDLRYKCKSDWEGFDEQSRRLNGVYASLETNEWTMIKIFEELAYSHYKNGDWSAMFRQKFRLRFIDTDINEEITHVFSDASIVKKFFRLDRDVLIMDMIERGYYYPINLNNIIYFCNITRVKDEDIMNITPNLMIKEMALRS
ncbi:MAG: RelA/SpoT domain-containing protein [Thiomicrorhabdus sp.]|nr:RelA/SpoT domain-containing protein [Thiomicrorhabdus sp.]